MTFLGSGCHTYRTVDSAPQGATVRVSVPVRSALAAGGMLRTESIEGRVVQSGDTLSLATETRRSLGAYRDIVQLDTLRLARDQIAGLEVRELSRSRSVVLGVIIAVGAGAAGFLAYNAAGGGSTDNGDGGEPPALEIRTSVFGRLLELVAR